jgi:hypothetical protein
MKKTALGNAMAEFNPNALERLQTDFSTAAGKDQRGDIMVRLPHAVRRSLRQLALDRDTTMQQLMEEAINLVLVQYGRDPML